MTSGEAKSDAGLGAPAFSTCVEQYTEFRNAMTITKHDPELVDLYTPALQGAASCAAQLNALVCLTPDVRLFVREEDDPLYAPPSEGAENSNTIVVYPASGNVNANCSFEVHYDEREWLPCVILEARPHDAQEEGLKEEEQMTALWRLTVGIIGYNVILENAVATQLRPFDAAALLEVLQSGLHCHAVHPHRYGYEPCVVQRLTVSGSVLVSFPNEKAAALQGADAHQTSKEGGTLTVEVPLCHVRVQRVHKELRPTRHLSAEEKRERRLNATRQRRERDAARIVEGAESWQETVNDMMMLTGASAKKSAKHSIKRRR